MIPIEVALNYYEDKITENIQSLQDEIIATIIKENNPISIRISNITTHQYTERTHIGRLQFKFNDTPITIRIGLNSRKLRVYFHRNNNSVHNSWSVLINLDQNNEKISFQALSWNVRGGQLSKHFIFWYGDNKNLLLDEEFKDIAPNPTLQNGQAVILSKEIPEFFVNSDTFNNNNLTEIGKGQLDAAANIHAKTIVVRCLDWILYNAYISNANLDFDLERNINIRDRLFPTDFFPVENAETPAQPRHRITAHELRLKCEGKGLYYSHDIYQTIATSMNLGRHLILTGPPGCGKSRLAELVGEMVNGTPPKIVTASPSWTSGEIVGRYFPRLGDGKLRFHPGAFLQASEENRSLVIDEMNRANLDECMGELFTVLAGQIVDLPYKDTIDDDGESDEGDEMAPKKEKDYGYIKIIPNGTVARDYPENSVYRIGDGFRLIGTMNDSDRSALHNLSFALLRRFNVIGIKPPETPFLNNIVANKLNTLNFPAIDRHRPNLSDDEKNQIKISITNILEEIFYPGNNNFGLIKERVAGVATLIDVIDFYIETIQSESLVNVRLLISNAKEKNEFPNFQSCFIHLTRSIISLGLTINVLPQLDALNDTKFQMALETIKNGLNNGPHHKPYLFITTSLDGDRMSNQVSTDNSTNNIADHFLKAAKYQYKDTMRETIVDNFLNQ